MKSRPCSKLTGPNGQSVVELALVLPFLVVLMLGLVDLSRAIQAHNIIANMSREGANLRSRTSLDDQDIMNSLANTAQPLAMSSKGMMYIIKVQGVAGSDPIIKAVAWEKGSGPNSTVDVSYVSKMLGNRKIEDKDNLYIFEIFYKYDSLFKPSGYYGGLSPQLHSVSIF